MRILIIAGPNGAGKTTFAEEFLLSEAACPEFVNADNIAAGLSPYQPESVAWQAGRLMLERIRKLNSQRRSFAIETTLSARSYIQHVREWQAAGYFVELHFLKLPDADWAVRRVAQRVRLGGHRIPEATIRKRYEHGWKNFTEFYKQVVDAWTLYDSSLMPPKRIASDKDVPPAEFVKESRPAYTAKTASAREDRHPTPTDGLAALTRAAEKAIARARAAGLEPVVRFETADRRNKTTN